MRARRWEKNGRIRVAAGERDGWVELSVSDNGDGMTREFMEKYLFKPFQTTKKQGMGIGLFHCKTIVEAHGGRIEVESEKGKGTTFRVMLPSEGKAEGWNDEKHREAGMMEGWKIRKTEGCVLRSFDPSIIPALPLSGEAFYDF